MNMRWPLLLAALAGTVYLTWVYTPQEEISLPVARQAMVEGVAGRVLNPVVREPMDREQEIDESASVHAHADLFQSHSWNPPPPPPKKAEPVVEVAPPLPFTYLGKQKTAEGVKVFFSEGGKIWIVQENMSLGASYKVNEIKPPLLTLTYLPLNQKQTIEIGLFD